MSNFIMDERVDQDQYEYDEYIDPKNEGLEAREHFWKVGQKHKTI